MAHKTTPLVQGGLETSIQVTVTMDLGESNIQVMKKYEDLVNEHNKEPVNDDVTKSALISDNEDDESDTESGYEQEHEADEGVGE